MKIPGHCSACGDLGFEVLEVWPQSSAFAGQPRRLGEPLDDIARATLVMMDGAMLDITVHRRCVDDLQDNLPALWRSVLERLDAERKAYRELKQRPFTPEQNERADQEQLRFIHNPPVGVLCVRGWNDEHTS